MPKIAPTMPIDNRMTKRSALKARVEIAFRNDTGVPDAAVLEQVTATVARGLPEIDCDASPKGPLYIYANGPSARHVPHLSPSLAVNGAYKLFPDGPDIWMACDAQPIVAGFVSAPKARTKHLVASKCHPSVFDALAGHDVQVYHIADCGEPAVPDGSPLIGGGPSITTTAIMYAHSVGYGPITVYGWDACFVGGEDHAVPQAHSRDGYCKLPIDGHVFETTYTWVQEAKAAWEGFGQLEGLDLRIEGDGMMAAFFRHCRARLAEMKESVSADIGKLPA